VTLEIILVITEYLEWQFVDLERPRSTGGDLVNVLFGYIFYMKMNSNDKIVCGNTVKNQIINALK
jgi:hypothetical protein